MRISFKRSYWLVFLIFRDRFIWRCVTWIHCHKLDYLYTNRYNLRLKHVTQFCDHYVKGNKSWFGFIQDENPKKHITCLSCIFFVSIHLLNPANDVKETLLNSLAAEDCHCSCLNLLNRKKSFFILLPIELIFW